MQAEREKKRKHKSNAERVGAIFVRYIIENYEGVSPEARTLNRIIGGFTEGYSITETKQDFLRKLKAEEAIKVQHGNHQILVSAAQQTIKASFPKANRNNDDEHVNSLACRTTT